MSDEPTAAADDRSNVDPGSGEVLDAPPHVPFAAWLQDLRRGVAHAACTDGLAELVEAVLLCRKPGTFSLQIKVKPAGNGQVVVEDEVIVKPPKEELPTSIYFVDREMNLLRDDPDALPLGELRRVPPQ